MTEMFRCRIDRKLLGAAKRVTEEIGTTPGDVVRLLFVQMVKRRTIPFPVDADGGEDEILPPSRRRVELWDQMNEGKPAAR